MILTERSTKARCAFWKRTVVLVGIPWLFGEAKLSWQFGSGILGFIFSAYEFQNARLPCPRGLRWRV